MEQKERAGKLIRDIIKPKIDTLDYGFTVLSNGLKVLLISDPETKTSSAALGVNVGFFAENGDIEGLAHFCEHLLFMGNKRYPLANEFDDYITKNGGLYNASTLGDRTIYYFDVNNEAFEGALDIFSEYFISSTFNESTIEKEIHSIDNEFSNNSNNDLRRLARIKNSEINKGSPFNHFGDGNSKTLSLPDIRDKLIAFYKKFYTSEIMNLCIYSNKTLDELIKLAEKYFVPIPKIENFKMPRYDEVKPYDETNLKTFYKIVPLKDLNQITLEWYLPYCDDYHADPLGFLSYVVGDKNQYTLTSSLNKDNLCNSLLAGKTGNSKTYMSFYIMISLTKKGVQNYKEVILRCLKFIKIMQNKDLNRRYYEEAKALSQLAFDYKPKSSPISATKTYASRLMDFDPKDAIVATYYSEINEDLIKKYLNMLQLDNLNIYFLTNLFQKECTLTEKYFGTKYTKEKITITEDEINAYKCEHIFDYPPINEFIPKNFDILPRPEKIFMYPEKIKSQKNMDVWFLQDTIFKIPKAYLVARFIAPIDLCDFSEVKISIMSSLLDKIITRELKEFLYSASEAKAIMSFAFNANKALIMFEGFNDSLKKGMINILNKIKNLDINTEQSKETLELYQKDILRKVKNSYLDSSYNVNTLNMAELMIEQHKTPKDTINFLEEKKITIEELVIFKNAFFKNSKSKWLIQGNITKELALEIVEEANKILEIDINKEIIRKESFKRPVVIKKNYNYIFRSKSINPEEKSSSLISIYQADILNTKDNQYIRLLMDFLKEKFYHQLRTKEGLGYIVILKAIETSKYCSLENIIQSNSKTPEYCASRVRNFYKESFQKVKDITDEEFKLLVDTRLSLLDQKDDNLSTEFLRNWKEIEDDTYRFDFIEKYIEALKKCNKEEFIQFYEKYFVKELAILDCEHLCEEHYEQNEKEIKETKILEGENIIKRVICDTPEDFKACNQLGVIHNNPVFMKYNN